MFCTINIQHPFKIDKQAPRLQQGRWYQKSDPARKSLICFELKTKTSPESLLQNSLNHRCHQRTIPAEYHGSRSGKRCFCLQIIKWHHFCRILRIWVLKSQEVSWITHLILGRIIVWIIIGIVVWMMSRSIAGILSRSIDLQGKELKEHLPGNFCLSGIILGGVPFKDRKAPPMQIELKLVTCSAGS